MAGKVMIHRELSKRLLDFMVDKYKCRECTIKAAINNKIVSRLESQTDK